MWKKSYKGNYRKLALKSNGNELLITFERTEPTLEKEGEPPEKKKRWTKLEMQQDPKANCIKSINLKGSKRSLAVALQLPRRLSLKAHYRSSSSFASVISNCDALSALSSSTRPPFKPIHVQQTLLIIIHLHLLRRLLERTNIPPQLAALKTALPTFFGQAGYVSNHFLDSSCQAVKVYFEVHTVHAYLEHLPKLTSLASFFLEWINNLFSYTLAKLLNLRRLRIVLRKPSDLEFLNNSSSLFPRLKQLEVEVATQRTSVSLLLIEALKTNTTVTSVNLEDNSIGDEGARALTEAVKVNASVTGIDLGFNYRIGDEGTRALAEALKVNAAVTSIVLSENSIRAEGARALAEALKINASVTSVNLVSNYIGDEGARALAEALTVNTSVTSIVLSENSIRAKGARALAEALKVNTSVTSIVLSENSIRAEGARALAEALTVNTSVTSIDLRFNDIGDEGARALSDALKVNTSVTSVNLTQNSIRAAGARALAEALKVNAFVTSVNLYCNSIGDEGARALADVLKVNASVTLLVLGSNSIGDEGAGALAEALKVNHRVEILGVRQLN
ncbi:hypothetical protein GEMRC1_005505 [Eukaryota sp. GEM-RC1]